MNTAMLIELNKLVSDGPLANAVAHEEWPNAWQNLRRNVEATTGEDDGADLIHILNVFSLGVTEQNRIFREDWGGTREFWVDGSWIS